uniref:Uncharacterized protein n=1 Tax=Arundo donax TaxID=35708 RepID=A0A0A9AD54_ARUDO
MSSYSWLLAFVFLDLCQQLFCVTGVSS